MEHVKTMDTVKIMEDMDTMATNTVIAVREDAAHKTTGIGAKAVVVETTVILHITVGHTECVPSRAKIELTQRMATRRTQFGVIRCRSVR